MPNLSFISLFLCFLLHNVVFSTPPGHHSLPELRKYPCSLFAGWASGCTGTQRPGPLVWCCGSLGGGGGGEGGELVVSLVCGVVHIEAGMQSGVGAALFGSSHIVAVFHSDLHD